MTRALVVLFAFTFAVAGCMHAGHAASSATATSSAPMAQGGQPMGGGMSGMCPMSVPGTKVSAADTASGESLTFTTTPDQASALREKVHAMADMHNQHHASGASGNGGMMGGGMGGMGMGGMQMPPPSRATVEDLPDGARILVTPNDPADLQQLQSTVRGHAQEMQQHGCGMMQHGQHAM